ncbi:MAG: DMP19 family protein [Salibacteraceae bacterium]
MMENLSNRALISRLYSSANQQVEDAEFDTQNWSQWYRVVQGLTGPEKMVYVIVKLNQTVTNGGFVEFYETSHGIFAPEIVHVLNEIKALSTAEIVSSSMNAVNPKGLLDDAYKEFVSKLELTEEQKQLLYSEDFLYDQLQDHENLEDLLGNYLQELIK